MGAVSDAAGIAWAMAVPMLCFAVVLGFAWRAGGKAPLAR
jgi:FHS family L-fucose permease-like MFS transporter